MEETMVLQDVRQDEEYLELFSDIKRKIKESQLKASQSVNRFVIGLNWEIGRSIVMKQATEKWGSSVIETLSKDLQRDFPGMKGFSTRNIRSIGLILCKTKDDIKVEYALESSNHPIGVAEYQLVKSLPKEYIDNLPTAEQLADMLKNVNLIEETED